MTLAKSSLPIARGYLRLVDDDRRLFAEIEAEHARAVAGVLAATGVLAPARAPADAAPLDRPAQPVRRPDERAPGRAAPPLPRAATRARSCRCCARSRASRRRCATPARLAGTFGAARPLMRPRKELRSEALRFAASAIREREDSDAGARSHLRQPDRAGVAIPRSKARGDPGERLEHRSAATATALVQARRTRHRYPRIANSGAPNAPPSSHGRCPRISGAIPATA